MNARGSVEHSCIVADSDLVQKCFSESESTRSHWQMGKKLLSGFCFGRAVWIQPHWRSDKRVKNVPPVSCTHFHDGKLRKCVDKVQLCTVSASWIKLTVGGVAFNWQTGTEGKEAEQQAEESAPTADCRVKKSRLYLTGKPSFSCFSSLLTAGLFHLMTQLRHSFENSPKKFPDFLSLVIFLCVDHLWRLSEVLCLRGSCRGYTHERLWCWDFNFRLFLWEERCQVRWWMRTPNADWWASRHQLKMAFYSILYTEAEADT